MAYITQSEIEAYFDNVITLDTTFADNLIQQNSAYVDSLAGTKFEQTNVIEEINLLQSSDEITLKNTPIITINTVYLNNGDEFSPEWTATTDYALISSENGIIKFKYALLSGNKKVKVDYDYDYATVPQVVKKLVLDLCIVDVLKKIVNTKTANDEGDMIDLGQIRIQGSYSQALANMSFLRKEIEQLSKDLYSIKSHYL